jgi:Zn-dependent protease
MIERSDIQEILNTVSLGFSVEDSMLVDGRLILHVTPRLDVKKGFSSVNVQLKALGYISLLRVREGRMVLTIIQRSRIQPARWVWNLLLLLATIGTTTYVGYQMSINLVSLGVMETPWHGALTFSSALLAILGLHELGHKIMANRWGVEATLPYFIPIPFFIGTFGAIIKMKDQTPNRDALFDIGAAGPIAGFLTLLPIAFLGIQHSYILPVDAMPLETISLPTPILFTLLTQVAVPYIPSGYSLLFHPVAFAAWVGMVVTMLNLIPVGMLDGGHISRALFGGKLHRTVSMIGIVVTFALGWFAMGILMLFFASARHAGPLEDVSRISPNRRMLSIGLLVILLLCVVPMWGTGAL